MRPRGEKSNLCVGGREGGREGGRVSVCFVLGECPCRENTARSLFGQGRDRSRGREGGREEMRGRVCLLTVLGRRDKKEGWRGE
jgi:hypothetical protein